MNEDDRLAVPSLSIGEGSAIQLYPLHAFELVRDALEEHRLAHHRAYAADLKHQTLKHLGLLLRVVMKGQSNPRKTSRRRAGYPSALRLQLERPGVTHAARRPRLAPLVFGHLAHERGDRVDGDAAG